jgi:uncharacterized protein with GYD domain
MAHYLISANYTAAGAAGVLKSGGSARRDAVEKLVESVGGRLETFYFAFGTSDVIAIAEVPTPEAAASVALAVASAGGAGVSTTVLLTPEDVDAACRLTPQYAPPNA